MESRKLFLILLLDILIFITGVMNLFNILEKSIIPGITEDEAVVLESNSGLLKGDVVDKINGISITDGREIEFLCDRLDIGENVNLDIIRAGKKINITVSTVRYYTVFDVVIFALTGLLFFILAVFVLLKSKLKLKTVFHFLLISAFVMIVHTGGKIGYFGVTSDIIIRTMLDISYIAVPVTFLHFTFLFPQEKWKRFHYLMIPLYAFLSVIAFISFYFNLKLLAYDSISSFADYAFFKIYIIEFLFIPFFVLILANLIHSYLKFIDLSERKKLLWVYVGIIFGPLVYVLLFRLPAQLIGERLIPESLMVLALAIAPVTFFIAIHQYRIIDIEFFINRATVYSIIISIFVGLYILIVFTASQLFTRAAINSPSVTSILAIVFLSLLFQPAKTRIQSLIDRKFFKINYNFRTAHQNFLDKIKECITTEQISLLVLNTVNEIIPVEKIGFINCDRMKYLKQSDIGPDFAYDDAFLKNIERLCIANVKKQPIARKGAVDENVSCFDPGDIFNQSDCCELILAHFSEDSNLICLLLLGKKKSKFRFSHEDLDLLRSIVFQAGVAIQKITLQNELAVRQSEMQRLEEINNAKDQYLSLINAQLDNAATHIFSLLPDPINEGPVRTNWLFVPSHKLGGDAFGYHWIDKNYFAFYLLDVSGHGIGSALHSVTIINLLNNEILPGTDFRDPVAVVRALNNYFDMDNYNHLFFTMWYGVYIRNEGKLKYLNAGHPPSILINGQDYKLLDRKNIPVGWTSDYHYKTETISLESYNTIYLYSDGAFEIQKSDGKMWDVENMYEFILFHNSPDDSELNGLYEYVKRIGNRSKLDDDLSLLKVKISLG